MHHPGGEIDAITAEVEERTSAILLRVGEPAEKLGTDADFLWTAMSIVDNKNSRLSYPLVWRTRDAQTRSF